MVSVVGVEPTPETGLEGYSLMLFLLSVTLEIKCRLLFRRIHRHLHNNAAFAK